MHQTCDDPPVHPDPPTGSLPPPDPVLSAVTAKSRVLGFHARCGRCLQLVLRAEMRWPMLWFLHSVPARPGDSAPDPPPRPSSPSPASLPPSGTSGPAPSPPTPARYARALALGDPAARGEVVIGVRSGRGVASRGSGRRELFLGDVIRPAAVQSDQHHRLNSLCVAGSSAGDRLLDLLLGNGRGPVEDQGRWKSAVSHWPERHGRCAVDCGLALCTEGFEWSGLGLLHENGPSPLEGGRRVSGTA